MIYYSKLLIQRVIMHRICSKVSGLIDSASVNPSDSMIELNDNLKRILQDRLITSFGNQSKSFELSIANTAEGSCFSLIKDLHAVDDTTFIALSKDIAELLASAQGNKQIPGGYFLLLDCVQHDGSPVYICLKAEAHSALSVTGNSAQALENIILSPAQKMYKAAVFEQVSSGTPLDCNNFRAYLFDSQFNSGTKLAEYFYKDFLGLTISDNARILTKQFYELMNATIDAAYLTDVEKSYECKDSLYTVINNHETTINPSAIISEIIELDKRDLFIRKVVNVLPSSFPKDTNLLQNVLRSKNLRFGDSIRLSVRNDGLNNISISSDPENPNVKIIRITT